MVGLKPRCTPAELAALLAGLEVHVTAVDVQRNDVSLPDYPGGPRPSSLVHVSGGGQSGCGEHVAFTVAEHQAFGASMAAWFESNRSGARRSIEHALGTEVTGYGRAALEAALVDLGLRQAGLSLGDLTGVPEAALRFVVSLAATRAPLAAMASVRAEGFTGGFKIDVDPTWPSDTLAALAADPSVVIFDFKGKGEPALVQRFAALAGSALFEDPPSSTETIGTQHRVSRDVSVPDAQAVRAARSRGEAVNLKAPRMGGPLAVLRGLDAALAPLAESAPVTAYLGGMFEVSIGRSQARQLAALYCPTGPNDLAPNLPAAASATRVDSPLSVRFDQPGFGVG